MKAGIKFGIVAAALICAAGAMTIHAGAQQRGPRDQQGPNEQRPPMSAQDRAAFLDARLAAIHAGLRLTADQERLWPSVEAAARDRAKVMMELREKNRSTGRPLNPIDGLQRRGEAETALGNADTKLATAAQPLWSMLTDEQKRRFHILAHRIIGGKSHWQRPGNGQDRPRWDDEHGMDHQGPRPRDDFAPPPSPRSPPPPR